jgi:hypothetical protein
MGLEPEITEKINLLIPNFYYWYTIGYLWPPFIFDKRRPWLFLGYKTKDIALYSPNISSPLSLIGRKYEPVETAYCRITRST